MAFSNAEFVKEILIFTSLLPLLTVGEVVNYSNKCWLCNKAARFYFYHVRHNITPSFPKKRFSETVVLCNSSNLWNFLISQPNVNSFTQEVLQLSVLSIKIWCSPFQNYSEVSTFNTFLLLFTVDEVCNASSE